VSLISRDSITFPTITRVRDAAAAMDRHSHPG